MPHIYIDGQKVETEPGQTIIEAAYKNGLQIPHFCWHPELSIAGNCRMCLVEVGLPKRTQDGSYEMDAEGHPNVNYLPKLQIACATPVSDGMHVHTNNAKAIHAQEAVMEFLLINHPLDCPICDEAGECKLQEYAFEHSKGESRFEENKVHKDKRVPWGPYVLFDAERCILCSRCIRFSKEYAKQDVLTFMQRGDHVTIKLFDGTQLDNNYSLNVTDICPVGALTSRDFRFKTRIWEMSFNDSVCNECSRGCNIQIGVRNNEILRIDPKTNMKVNEYWMCDHGRVGFYPKINNERVLEPYIKANGKINPASWDEAIAAAAAELKKYKPAEIMFIGSGKSSTENNYMLAKFAKNVMKSNNLDYFKRPDPAFADDILRTSDRNPNSLGCLEAGVVPSGGSVTLDNFIENINQGHIKAVYLMDDDLDLNEQLLAAFAKLSLLVVHASNHSQLTNLADVTFASSTFAESDGTFINVNKRVQLFTPALVTNENLQRMGLKMSRLDKFGAVNDRWTNKEIRNTRSAWRVLTALSKQFAVKFEFIYTPDVFADLAKNNLKFKNMTYQMLAKHQGVNLGKGDSPDPVQHNYVSHYKKPN